MFEHWLPQSAPNIFFDFLHPHLGDMLFSTRHGWLSWSPIVAIAALGMPAVVRRLQWFGAGLVAIAVGELYVNASLSDWWGGAAFGARRLTDQTLLVALGLGAVFAFLLQRRLARLVYAALAAGIAWTVLLLGTFYYIIANDTGPTWRDFLVDQLHAPLFTPRLFIQGTVLREVAMGDIFRAFYSGLIILAVVGAALWLGTRADRSRTSARPPVAGLPLRHRQRPERHSGGGGPGQRRQGARTRHHDRVGGRTRLRTLRPIDHVHGRERGRPRSDPGLRGARGWQDAHLLLLHYDQVRLISHPPG